MFISLSSLLCMLGVAAAGYLVWSAYCWFDKRRETRRKYASKLGQKFAKYKAMRLADMLIDYGSGDYSGFFAQWNHIQKEMEHGNDVLQAEFEAIAAGIVAEKAAEAPAPTTVAVA